MAKFLSATEAAPRVGFSAWTLVDYCRNFPGFGFRLRPGGRWRIPEEHIARVLAGEPVPEIAASPSLPLKPAKPPRSQAGGRRCALVKIARRGRRAERSF